MSALNHPIFLELNSHSSKTGISRRLSPLGVFVPFRMLLKNDPTASFQAASPAASPSVVQNSSRNSLGSFRTSSFFLLRPNDDLRRLTTGVDGQLGTDVGSNSVLDDPLPNDKVNRDPPGEVLCIPGDVSGDELDGRAGRG